MDEQAEIVAALKTATDDKDVVAATGAMDRLEALAAPGEADLTGHIMSISCREAEWTDLTLRLMAMSSYPGEDHGMILGFTTFALDRVDRASDAVDVILMLARDDSRKLPDGLAGNLVTSAKMFIEDGDLATADRLLEAIDLVRARQGAMLSTMRPLAFCATQPPTRVRTT